MRGKQKVVYIVGAGRSGSTLLDKVLGSDECGLSTGEMRTVFVRFSQAEARCSCGSSLATCEVWGEALPAVLTAHGVGDPVDLAAFQQSWLRARRLPRLLGSGAPAGDVRRYGSIISSLYAAAAEIASARFVIDSSKRAADAAVVAGQAGLDAYFVHLVRDPRGVAASWLRNRPDVEIPDGALPRRSSISSMREWLALNASAEFLLHRIPSDRSVRVRYEDLVLAPAATVKTILDMIGERPNTPLIDAGGVAHLRRGHLVLGNPGRFAIGDIRLLLDKRWRTELTPGNPRLIKVMSRPLSGRYGYRQMAGP